MIASNTRRPRNVDSPRAAAILYGDWGTSKAYVIGLAFAVAGYASFWLIAAMCLLTALVGINYMAICKHYPDGGGVYASVRHRSEIVSIVGAFLLIADYIVTAALSALSAFDYFRVFNVTHPELWAAGAIALIGGLNVFGPRHTGGLAFLISVPAAIVVVILGCFAIPHMHEAVHNVQPLTGGFWKNWEGFVGVVLALSGVEAIANATGVMKLNPGTTDAKPNVSKTSTPAILWVMFEVCIFTALLGLAMHALPNLVINKDNVDAPSQPGVRDYMLSYIGQIFVGGAWGPLAGKIAAGTVSVVFGFLLLSAVNTAIVDLIAISFLMSRDGELPPAFQKLNKFGVPNLGIIVATTIPAILVIAVKDMSGLADLYAVGVVGAIATNLGASSTDKKLDLLNWERILMFCTFLIMLAIELSLFWTKPSARVFTVTVLTIGLILRGIAAEFAHKKKVAEAAVAAPAPTAAASAAAAVAPHDAPAFVTHSDDASNPPMMCAIRGVGKTLDFAVSEAMECHRPLYLLFVRTVPVLSEGDYKRKWQDDEEAREIFTQARTKAKGHPVIPCYAVSDSVADTIVDITATMGATHLILGAPDRSGLVNLLRGNLVRAVSDSLPDDIHLLVYA
jgi:amino acid transporter/nucleotide-binding universal stress UspA family protein